jgi:hypothetical protein
MGLYFTATITCNKCGNYKTYDMSDFNQPEELRWIRKTKPEIVCGFCGSTDITDSDSLFCSADMTFDGDSMQYKAKDKDVKWTLPSLIYEFPVQYAISSVEAKKYYEASQSGRIYIISYNDDIFEHYYSDENEVKVRKEVELTEDEKKTLRRDPYEWENIYRIVSGEYKGTPLIISDSNTQDLLMKKMGMTWEEYHAIEGELRDK